MNTPDEQPDNNQNSKAGSNEKLEGLINHDHQARRRHAYGLVRFMKSLRIVLPLLVIALLAAIYNFADFRSQPSVKTAKKEDKTGESSSNALINPKFESRDPADRPFTITADKAFQPQDPGDSDDSQTDGMTITQADTIHLDAPLGDIALNDGTWLAVKGKRGIYSRDKKRIVLKEDVHIFHDSGYELRTDALDVDIAQATARSDMPVTVTGPEGQVEAEGLRADEKDGILIFHGPARLEMQSPVTLP